MMIGNKHFQPSHPVPNETSARHQYGFLAIIKLHNNLRRAALTALNARIKGILPNHVYLFVFKMALRDQLTTENTENAEVLSRIFLRRTTRIKRRNTHNRLNPSQLCMDHTLEPETLEQPCNLRMRGEFCFRSKKADWGWLQTSDIASRSEVLQ